MKEEGNRGRRKEGREGRERKRHANRQESRDREEKVKIEVLLEADSWGRKVILQPLKRSKIHMQFTKCSFP